MNSINKKVMITTMGILVFSVMFSEPVMATDVATAIEETWKSALTQIQEVTNNVIFPVVDCILVIMLFIKLSTSYFDYKKHGEFDFMPIAVLFFGLVFSLTAPLYIWDILS